MLPTMLGASLTGDVTGRTWSWDPIADAVANHAGLVAGKWKATADDDGSLGLVARHDLEDEEFVGLLIHALAMSQISEVQAAKDTIRQLIDMETTDDSVGGVWEWADRSLWEVWRDPVVRASVNVAEVAEDVLQNVGAGLAALHAGGLAHLDVTPSNILEVNGVWKLADLDSALPIGMSGGRAPHDPRWLHPDRLWAAANKRDIQVSPEFDLFGLNQVIAEILDPDSTLQ
jgi:Protein kinase domain